MELFNDLDVNDATDQFETDLLRFAKQAIPTKEIIVRRDDKPWYDSKSESILEFGTG